VGLNPWIEPTILILKPITLLMFAGFLGIAVCLRLLKARLLSLSERWFDLLSLLTALYSLASVYETLLSFSTWIAQMVAHPDIPLDQLTVYDPQVGIVYNLLIMSKLYCLSAFSGIYAVLYLRNLGSVRYQHPPCQRQANNPAG